MALLHCTCFRTSENIHIVSCPENDKVSKRRIEYHLPLYMFSLINYNIKMCTKSIIISYIIEKSRFF